MNNKIEDQIINDSNSLSNFHKDKNMNKYLCSNSPNTYNKKTLLGNKNIYVSCKNNFSNSINRVSKNGLINKNIIDKVNENVINENNISNNNEELKNNNNPSLYNKKIKIQNKQKYKTINNSNSNNSNNNSGDNINSNNKNIINNNSYKKYSKGYDE